MINRSGPVNDKQRGFTLIELIVIIVVIGVGLAGLTIAIHQATQGSTDPLFKQQANAIAQSYLEEIMQKSFCDPDFASTSDLCMANCTSNACTSGCSLADGGRSTYDDVCDYNGLPDSVVRDHTGAAVAGLESYNVTVAVIGTAAANFGGLDATMGSVVRIDVNVQHDNGASSALSGYRANY